MGAKSRRLLAPCEVGMTMVNWICRRFRLFQVSETLPRRSCVSLDRAAAVSQTRVGLRFRWNGKRRASELVFRIRRRRCRETRLGGSGQPVSRDTARRPNLNGAGRRIPNPKLDPVCVHPKLDQSAGQQGGGFRQENPHRESVWRLRPK